MSRVLSNKNEPYKRFSIYPTCAVLLFFRQVIYKKSTPQATPRDELESFEAMQQPAKAIKMHLHQKVKRILPWFSENFTKCGFNDISLVH